MTKLILTRAEQSTVTALVKAGTPVYIRRNKHVLIRDMGNRKTKILKNMVTGEAVDLGSIDYCRLLAEQYIIAPKFLPIIEVNN